MRRVVEKGKKVHFLSFRNIDRNGSWRARVRVRPRSMNSWWMGGMENGKIDGPPTFALSSKYETKKRNGKSVKCTNMADTRSLITTTTEEEEEEIYYFGHA